MYIQLVLQVIEHRNYQSFLYIWREGYTWEESHALNRPLGWGITADYWYNQNKGQFFVILNVYQCLPLGNDAQSISMHVSSCPKPGSYPQPLVSIV